MTTQEKRKQKLWLFLPLLVLPFLALAFFALGGGKGSDATVTASANAGINTALPGAKLEKNGKTDKLSVYDQARKDSAFERSHSAQGAFAALGWDTASLRRQAGGAGNHGGSPSVAESEAKIKEKLAEINRQVNTPQVGAGSGLGSVRPGGAAAENPQQAELERLEKVIQSKQQAAVPDPQMQQLNTMLDKIQQIQNPGLVQEKLRSAAVEREKAHPDSAFKAIRAVIDGNQKVLTGGVVRLKLLDSALIAGVHYPAGQVLSGSCAIMNQRLMLDIKNIRVGTSIVPVSLTVFSLDGMAGIAAPEAELGEAAGEGTNGALENMQFLSMDESLGTQAAKAGISAAKGLLGKKVRRVKVKLHGGQTVLLRINRS